MSTDATARLDAPLPEAGGDGLDWRRLELVPNCSLTPSAALVFFGALCGTSLTIALFLALQGYWPVLPFAGLELALLGWALRASLQRRHWTQVITVTANEVRVDTRLRGQAAEAVFPRPWARVTLRTSRSWHPSRLLIESSGRACEVGAFLTEEERRALHARLKVLVAGNTGS